MDVFLVAQRHKNEIIMITDTLNPYELLKRRSAMFRFIGAAAVYGFALYGLIVWLEQNQQGRENVEVDDQ